MKFNPVNKKNSKSLMTILLTLSMIILFQNCQNTGFTIKEADPTVSLVGADGDANPTVETPPSSSSPVIVSKQISFNVTNEVDILFVGDNSGSMELEQQQIASRFADFTSVVGGLNFRLAITTTDVSGTNGGKLVTFSNGSKYLQVDSSTSLLQVEQMFSTSIQLGSAGSGDERGVYATNMAIKNNSTIATQAWMRPNAHLAVILFSDENERSTGENLQELDMPASVISSLQQYQGPQKSMKFHSLVIKSDDLACLQSQTTQAGAEPNILRYGKIYEQLSVMTGGLIGDICAPSYTQQLINFAQDIQSSVGSAELGCSPVIDAVHTFQVFVNNALVTPDTYRIEGSKILFNTPISVGSSVDVKYYCEVK